MRTDRPTERGLCIRQGVCLGTLCTGISSQRCRQSAANLGSQIGDQSPVNSPNQILSHNKISATGSWLGNARPPGLCQRVHRYPHWRGEGISKRVAYLIPSTAHSDRVGGVAWHTQATLSQHETSVDIANGGTGDKVALWSLKRYGLYKPPLRLTNTSYFHYLSGGSSAAQYTAIVTASAVVIGAPKHPLNLRLDSS